MEPDPKLRAYYTLAEAAEGEDLERIRAAIAERRRELGTQEPGFSAFDDVVALPPDPGRWTPPDPADFKPDPR